MGIIHFFRADDARAVKYIIKVDDTRAARDELPASERAFNSLQRMQQLPRHQQSFRLHDAVQKPRLREKIHRLSFIERRPAEHLYARAGQSGDRALKIRGAVAKIRSEREIDELAAWHTRE